MSCQMARKQCPKWARWYWRNSTGVERVRRRSSHFTDPVTVAGLPTLIAIHGHDIPLEFPDEALREAANTDPLPLDNREDLRDTPLVTIDGEDARDFDDAVWAERLSSKDCSGGWHVIVAISDVAWYVRPGTALDRSACERGNSVYFPDRVVPMLPEQLSNGVVSLVPGVERACIAVHLWIDDSGKLRRHRFARGVMKSHARLTYEEVEAGRYSGAGWPPEIGRTISSLYGAFGALLRARRARQTLDLDLPERRVILRDTGEVASIGIRERLDSHRMIEELMIAANVAAARTLEKFSALCLYRNHDRPSEDSLKSLRRDLLPLRLAGDKVEHAGTFRSVLQKVAGRPEAERVGMAVLRAQSQAYYGPKNIGHFGLSLGAYTHFTSPVRRYADLLVHRSLITAIGLAGGGGLQSEDGERFGELGRHLSMTERRAVDAEREAVHRYSVQYLASHVGARFEARITDIHKTVLFVSLDATGVSGIIPLSGLGPERFHHDSRRRKLVGSSSGMAYGVGDPLQVKLETVDTATASLRFSVAADSLQPSPARRRRRNVKKRARA